MSTAIQNISVGDIEKMALAIAKSGLFGIRTPEQAVSLMLIAQVEMDGVWAIRGGMYALVQNLQTLAQARGVQFHFNTPCQRIDVQGGAVRAVLEAAESNGHLGGAPQGATQEAPAREISPAGKAPHCLNQGRVMSV